MGYSPWGHKESDMTERTQHRLTQDGQATLYVFSRTVLSDSLQPHGLQPARLLCPWSFPDRSNSTLIKKMK